MAGATVVQRKDDYAILGEKKALNHVLHIFLVVLTLGLWTTPYLIIALTRKDVRYRVEVDRWGHAWTSVTA